MRTSRIPSAMAVLFLVGSTSQAAQTDNSGCGGIDIETEQRVTQDLIAKFGLRLSTPLKFCKLLDRLDGFMRLRVSSLTLSQPFERDLYLTKDKLLVFDLIGDASVGPDQEHGRLAIDTRARLEASSAPSVGNPFAPVTIVMFSDFQCSFCREATKYIEEKVLHVYSREVRFVYRQLPLSSHDWASTAARVGACINLQNPDSFWKYHDFVFENQDRLTLASFSNEVTKLASSLAGINSTQLYSCLGSSNSDTPLLEDRNLASALGVEETPVFFVNGKRVVGFAGPDELKNTIEVALQRVTDAENKRRR